MMMHVSCTISTCSFSVMAWNNPLYSFTAPVSNDFSRYANIASLVIQPPHNLPVVAGVHRVIHPAHKQDAGGVLGARGARYLGWEAAADWLLTPRCGDTVHV